jgi:hypothetical protein
MPEEALANVLGLDNQILTTTLTKLLTYGVARRRGEDGAIFNKRMVDDEKLCKIRREAGKKGGNPALLNQNPTTVDNLNPTPSSSSSSSPSGIKPSEAIASVSPPAEKPQRADPIPYQKIIDLYHEKLPTLRKVAVLTTKRKGQIAARWRTGLPDLQTWAEYFEHIGESAFLMGKNEPTNGHKRFVADLEWITNETNFAKIAEGKFHGV